MYVADRLVFVELHKTGGTHIGTWLSRLAPGEQVGKHNRVPPALRDRFVIGSVRNPWDWYVSLWGYGCDSKGAVFQTVTRGLDFGYLWRDLGIEMGSTGIPVGTMLRQAVADLQRPVAAWRRVYRPVSQWAGILTYRYLKLFTTLDARLYTDTTLATEAGARAALAKHRLVQGIIRTEHLEEDFINALNRAGYALTEEQCAAVRAGRAPGGTQRPTPRGAVRRRTTTTRHRST